MSLVENEARLRQAVRQIQRCLREEESKFTAAVPATSSTSPSSPSTPIASA
jgi:hypothetical protein